MGDMSAEPSMEEILSSIKRIIAEEGEGTQTRGRRARAAPQPIAPEQDVEHDPEHDEVLELSDPIPAAVYDEPEPEPEPAPMPPPARPQAAVQPAAAPQAQRQPIRGASVQPAMTEEPILSQRTAAASLGSLETLSKLLVKPEPESDGTLEGLVREMLRPMLREWLDTHLPDMVETLVAREIAKITAQMR
jgi:cell pole-organizing protein PopZ